MLTAGVEIELPAEMGGKDAEDKLGVMTAHPVVAAIGMDGSLCFSEIEQRADRSAQHQWKFRPLGKASRKRCSTSA